VDCPAAPDLAGLAGGSEALDGAGCRSALLLPLRGREASLGLVCLVMTEPDRRFGPVEVQLAQGLVDRAGLALDNARLYREAQLANRLKDEFLATLSHELRTPLNAIVGWTTLLRSGQLDADAAARALETIDRNVRAQTRLIEDILDVSRIVTGKLKLHVQELALAPVVDAAIESIRPAAEAKGIRVQRVLDGTGVVMGDPARLQQVVWNLLANSVKFTPRGGRVHVRVWNVRSQVEVVVEDTGVGIAPAFLPHVFERFRQGDSSSTRPHGGLGLGLAIVRHLVELHGGTVEASSEGEGRGARFTVRLPTVAVAARSEPASTPVAREEGLSPLPSELRLDGLRVLVVDDESDTRELLATVLTQLGAVVVTASSGEEALALLARERPDVLLSDIEMPGSDGYTLIRRVRSLPAEQGGRVPAAALTAYARAEDRLSALLAGFQVHMAKPVQPAELAAVLVRLSGRQAPPALDA
jgi:signal transduction histidine kinase/CheY-like chemotaxis protein